MQKTVSVITAFVITASSFAACILRFYQLLKFTDRQTGFISGDGSITYFIYGLLILACICAILYSLSKKKTAKAVRFQKSKAVLFSSFLLCAAFFYDFLYQCYNCFEYIQKNAYLEYNYLIPMALSGIFALLTCFYFITFALTYSGSNFDFRNFTFLHFAPAAWTFLKLIIIMVKIMDITAGVETFCEFILLTAYLCFSFCFILAVDKAGEIKTGMFVFSALVTAVMSAVVALPRVAMLLIGRGDMLNSVTFSCCLYIMLGVFAVSLVRDINKADISNK
ncbi:MAG: hypothetical protein ACI4IQ_05345 [Eubacterium sp.]